MAGKVLLVSGDVMFWARVHGAAKAAGVPIARIADELAMDHAFREGGVTTIFADLATRSVDLCGWARRWKSQVPAPRLVAYGSHVDTARMQEAVAAGFDEVMPNSKFHRSLEELLRQ